MVLQVESRPGYNGEFEPLAFMLGASRILVLQIIDRWIGEDHSYFKISASDGGLYILRHTPSSRLWELTQFSSPRDVPLH